MVLIFDWPVEVLLEGEPELPLREVLVMRLEVFGGSVVAKEGMLLWEGGFWGNIVF